VTVDSSTRYQKVLGWGGTAHVPDALEAVQAQVPGVLVDDLGLTGQRLGPPSGNRAEHRPLLLADGSFLLSGVTASPDFPTTDAAVQRELRGMNDGFLAKPSSSSSCPTSDKGTCRGTTRSPRRAMVIARSLDWA